jgi:hypothetical protein
MFDARSLKPGDKIFVIGLGRTIIDWDPRPDAREEIETTFVCFDGMGDALVLKSDGWELYEGYSSDTPVQFIGENVYNIPLTNIIKRVLDRQTKNRFKKKFKLVCRGCGSKVPWNKVISKRNYVCLLCRTAWLKLNI